MIYSVRGAAAAMVFVAGVGAYTAYDRGANYRAAKANVYLIDRTCDYTETVTTIDGKSTSKPMSGSCIEVDDWDAVREKRNKVVAGKAVIHVSYTAPQDGNSHTAELRFDGRDDEFYDLKAGDQVDVLVSNSDPSKIRKA